MHKIKPKPSIFWYLREDATFDLDTPWAREMFVQEILSKGKDGDIRELFVLIGEEDIREVFYKIKRFLPQKIKSLWEGYFEQAMGT